MRVNLIVSFLSYIARPGTHCSLLLALLLTNGLLGCAYHPMTPRGVSDIGEILPFGSQTTPNLVLVTHSQPKTRPVRAQTLLSPGDALRLDIFDDTHFSGRYVVDQSGHINIPYLGQLPALGISPQALRQSLTDAFVAQEYFRAQQLRIAIEVVSWAPAQVSVAGAVHQPGQVVINAYPEPDKLTTELRSGAATVKRFVQHALLAAGGLRADADLSNVYILRGQQKLQVPLTKQFDGREVADVSLISGDRLIVGSTGVFQEPLARPSAFTSPGFRVYLSNLTTPAINNASSSVGRDSTRLPTGARLSHAIASANCFGGTPLINAARRVKYVTRNPLNQTVTTHVYNVEEVMQRADDSVHNPYLQPEDQLGCYESPVTILREAARTAYDLVAPAVGVEVLRNAISD